MVTSIPKDPAGKKKNAQKPLLPRMPLAPYYFFLSKEITGAGCALGKTSSWAGETLGEDVQERYPTHVTKA